MASHKNIFVYWDSLSGGCPPELLGILSVQLSRGKEVFSFEFDDGFLTRHPNQCLDPQLQMYHGPQFSEKGNFGLFLDSSPDRWGRKLMLRREALRAARAHERPRALLESDFLLGVYDESRMGALRFKLSPEGNFVNEDQQIAVPPWTRLRELEEASLHLENEEPSTDHEKWLATLLAPGSSLGGARPKASVLSPQGELWIAKFPRKNDDWNTSAWEYTVSIMARDAGLKMPECRLEQFSPNGATFLTKRFDRRGKQRVHFASTMTMLGKTDGDDATSGVSYLDIAEWIMQNDASPQDDLRELWRRIVFSMAVSNTDDHLRNHGFLLEKDGWHLSPAYDLNPNPQGTGLALNVSLDDNRLDFDLARETAPFFRLNHAETESIIAKVCSVVRNWRSYARRVGLAVSEQDVLASAFSLAEHELKSNLEL
jgi:serine/threonine-protein kinase HipA